MKMSPVDKNPMTDSYCKTYTISGIDCLFFDGLLVIIFGNRNGSYIINSRRIKKEKVKETKVYCKAKVPSK